MAVLVMDTATETLAVAVGVDQQLLGAAAYRVVRGHSVLLQPVIAEVVRHAGLEMKSLQAIAVGTGPGSYTGVRIGVSTAKAMALALGIELITVPTLLALAEAALPGGLTPIYHGEESIAGHVQERHELEYVAEVPAVAPAEVHSPLLLSLLYARRQRAFGALYQKRQGRWCVLQTPQVRLVENWLEIASEFQQQQAETRPIAVVHDFVPRYGLDDLLKSAAVSARWSLEEVAGQFGPALLRLVAAGEGVRVSGQAIHRVSPEYTLPVEAEVKLAEGGKRYGDR